MPRGRPSAASSSQARASTSSQGMSSLSQSQAQPSQAERFAATMGPEEMEKKVDELVHYLLIMDQRKVPIKKQDINKEVMKESSRALSVVMKKASERLLMVFGIEVVELQEKLKGSYILINTLDKQSMLTWSDVDNAKTGLLTVILSIIYMSGNVILDDDQNYQRMKTVLCSTGRGRPLNIPCQPLTNRVLLQLDLLRCECMKSWQEMSSFLPRVVGADTLKDLEGFSIKTETEAVKKLAADVCSSGEDTDTFLSVNIANSFAARNVGLHLLKHGVFRHHLLDHSRLTELAPPAEVTNGMIVDFMFFLKKEGLCVSQSRPTLDFFGMDTAELSDKQLRSRLSHTVSTFQALNKSRKRPNGEQKMNVFLGSVADLGNTVSSSSTAASTLASTSISSFRTAENFVAAGAESRAAALRRQLEERGSELAQVRERNKVLHENSLQLHKALQVADEKLATADKKNTMLAVEISGLRELEQQARQTIHRIRRSNFYKRVQRKERYLKSKEAIISAHQTGCCPETARALRKKIKAVQTECSSLRKRIEKIRETKDVEICRLNQAVQDLSQQPAAQIHNIEFIEEIPVLHLKDEQGHFKKEAIVCVMQLVGENEVPPGRCGSVIQTVAKHVLNAVVPESHLPSMRSAERFADHGHVIGKIHIAETLLESENWDIHTDGTSRCGKKFVSQQMNVPGKALATGFIPVSTENTTTLVDITMNLLHELSDLYSEEQAQETFLQLLKGMSAVMSDRAAVMKSFGHALNEERRGMLQTEDELHFLYCNAHFLLGLSSACEKDLKKTEKDSGQHLGRDRLPKFQSFKNSAESSVSRYIRLACDCFGPRGDEKHGCQELWEAFCAMTEVKSAITSFGNNRFNNYFEAAAALHFHREDISGCLQSLPKINRKLESVQEDNRSDEIDCQLIALGLLFYRVTGPYWELLGRDVHYLDFCHHVVRMHDFLQKWADNAVDAFADQFEPLFGTEFMPNAPIFRAMLNSQQETKEEVKRILKKLCKGCLETTKTQLADFLPEGRYHGVQDEDTRKRLQHSKLTNLIGELWHGLKSLGISPDLYHETFGDVKKLVMQEFVKQAYLELTKLPNNEQPVFEVRWGQRAKLETSKLQILKFVSLMYNRDPEQWTTQYQDAKNDAEEAS